jgi:FlaA1/EpsC-like NDP-sugar epimerase
MDDLAEYYKGKKILVTGGVGSIGNVIVKRILDYEPDIVRILDNDETGLFNITQEYGLEKVRPLVGDVRDKDRIRRAFENIDIVFHAAALKHVPLCEFNPFEAVKTNIIGTQNLIDVALEENIEKFVTISTDKAVNPVNVMGASKLLGERLTITAHNYIGWKKTIFTCVRFGNVLDTSGSIIPVIRNQIENGGPITVTDPEMTRFMMSIENAVDLVLKSAVNAKGGEIFILKMPALRIGDLAEVMIEIYAEKYGHKPEDIKTQIIGKRPGEKMYEDLITSFEAENAFETDDMFIVTTDPDYEVGSKVDPELDYSSNDNMLTKEQIKSLILNTCE